MTPQARRSRSSRRVVAVTGAANPVGTALRELLTESTEPIEVRALDAPEATDPDRPVLDLQDPALADRLADVDVLVHLGVAADPDADPVRRRDHNVAGTAAVFAAAVQAGVAQVVVVTSAMVYGAHPDNPVPLDEDAPLRAEADASLVGDLLEIEQQAADLAAACPDMAVCVVRPASLVGPGVDSVLTRYFEAPRLLTVREGRAAWQFCHVADLVAALQLVVTTPITGPVTVASPGWLEIEEVERVSGRRRLELPAAVAFGTAERLHRLGVTPAPASEIAFTVHPWVVPAQRLTAAGWSARFDNAAALQALLAESAGRTAIGARRLGRTDATATFGAAGATVAVLGAAALVRRARRRRLGG